jgi:serine/threonine-protein kinase
MVDNRPAPHSDETQLAPPSEGPAAFQETMAVAAQGAGLESEFAAMASSEFARYEEGEKIGAGGMGEVRAWLDHRVGREVAMKTIRGESGALGRFLREARVQGQLEHPAIVPVYDLAATPEGDPYFTMKRLRGQTLQEIVQALNLGDAEAEERFGGTRLLSVFLDICQAIAYAHSKGVLHRDLKPANIMLGDFGEVYVLDWGIARVAGEQRDLESPAPASDAPTPDLSSASIRASFVSDSAASEATEAGAVLGTLGYMPAEQIGGMEVDERSDLYALGAILFEILAGETLADRSSRGAVIAQTLDGIDPRPRLDARQVAPELIDACFRATRPNPAERHGSVSELHEQLGAFLEGDRDLERRRKLALEHIESAQAQLERDAPELERRAAALREAAHAVALDPELRAATDLLSRLLMEAPSETPPEVERELFAAAEAGGREQARTAAISYTAWFSFIGLILWMGLRDVATLGAFTGGVVLVIVASLLLLRSERLTGDQVMFAVYANIFLVSASTRVFGPFILAPGLIASSSMLFLMHPLLGGRHVAITLSAMASLLVPWGLEKAGVLQASYSFEGDSIHILANMAQFNALPTEILLVLSVVGPIAIAAAVAVQIRSSLDDANRRLAIQAWQLRRAVPAEAA